MTSIKIKCALIFTLLFWASAFVGIRIGLHSYSPGSLALLRFLIASGCMGLIYIYLPNKRRLLVIDRIHLFLIGIAGIGIYNICLNYGEIQVSASVAGFVIGLIPVLTILLSVLFLKERPKPLVWVGVVISFIGLLIIMLGEPAHSFISTGVLIILIASLMGAIYSVTQKPYLLKYHPVAVTAWVIWGGTALLLIFFPTLLKELRTASFASTFAAVYMGIFPAAVAYIAWCYVLNHFPISKAALSLYSLPILSTIMGLLFLKEKPSLLSLIGGLVALAGALFAYRVQTSRVPSDLIVPPTDKGYTFTKKRKPNPLQDRS